MSEQDVKNPPKARKQQFVRTYPVHDDILGRLRAKYATPMGEPDFSTLIRHCIEFKGPWVDEDLKGLLRDAIRTIEKLADQQAMPDDWYAGTLDRLKRAVSAK